jgi:molybdenum cofactor cytidylyltransferase
MPEKQSPYITAIVLAAGLSTRMGGYPKPLLPFCDQTVVEHILAVLAECPIQETVVVTGHCRQAVEQQLKWQGRTVFNPSYASGEMLGSVQVGLRAASDESDAALIVLGDQPALEASVVCAVIAGYREGLGSVVIPSFQMRRGHPLLIGSQHWSRILELQETQTLRDYLRSVSSEIFHVPVDRASILRDMDTPDEYRRELSEYLSRHLAEQAD